MATYIIGGLILLYAGIIVVRKIRAFRRGQYCSCGCSGCSRACAKKGEGHENSR
ncbi:MAG TPA: FeoB-associated Cys-rich membrane protein [Candidatus Avimonoglobus intestinipullorum]|uniref:FeoB-associated Cys-rich membrane protein n=1 Tax=Candidatus Avimonoglobus intestinipullorum TaxID=2840699 RepID=A0A9D1LTW5_9FIRM|nr:FeoB-associated Cys-rich membrane protein [Candidatus Avimonoglobus intestinipullorum]